MNMAGLIGASLVVVSSSAFAGLDVEVVATGAIEFNQISSGALASVDAGEAVTMSFSLDSTIFTDSASFPTRGYHIDQSTFSLAFESAAVELQSPFPGGLIPFFVLRDNDPAVDGFFVSTNVDFPVGVPLDQAGAFGQFVDSFSVTYTGDTLSSLDIVDAAGNYDFDGLTVFHWTIEDGPFDAMGMVFERLTITINSETDCPADIDMSGDVGFADLLQLLAAWGACPGCVADLDASGEVGFNDLLMLLAAWGPCNQ